MTRETKLGLVAVGAFVSLLTVVVYYKIRENNNAAPDVRTEPRAVAPKKTGRRLPTRTNPTESRRRTCCHLPSGPEYHAASFSAGAPALGQHGLCHHPAAGAGHQVPLCYYRRIPYRYP